MEKQNEEYYDYEGWERFYKLLYVVEAFAEFEQAEERKKKRLAAIPEVDQYQENNNLNPIPLKKTNFGPKMREYEEPLTQPLPEAFKNKIRALGGLEPTIMFVFKKILTNTDVDPHQNRLLIPFTRVRTHTFLTKQEQDLVERREKITVLFIDPECDEGEMNLTKWDMRKEGNKVKVSCNYALLTDWSKVVRKNKLESGNFVQLWSFRRGLDQLGLVLVRGMV